MASQSGLRADEAFDNSGVDDDDASNIVYDLEDSDNSHEVRNQSFSNQSNISRRSRRLQDDVEFHGPWVKAVSPKGDAFYLEKSSSLRHPGGSTDASRNYPAPSEPRRSSKSRRPESVNQNGQHDDPILPGSFSNGLMKKVTFTDTGIVKTIFVHVRSEPSSYLRHGSECERLFGIIPGYFQSTGSRDAERRVVVQGLLPHGAALKAGVKIGDWLMAVNDEEVNADNVDDMLSLITSDKKVKLTLQRVAMETFPQPKAQQQRHSSDDAEGLVKLVAGERLHESTASLRDVLHGVLYLALDISSDDLMDKEDVIYNYPRSQNSSLVDLRGAFVTLGQMLTDVTDNSAKNSSAVINDQFLHVAYCRLDRRIFLLCLPAARVSVAQLNHVMRDISRILLIIYGSINVAFEQPENHLELDHFFTLVFHRLLLAQERQSQNPNRQEFLEPFTQALCGIRAIMLPEPVKILIHNCLSEFEAADFADMAESYYNVRRSYTILGSCLYYKGYLLASHLQKEDAIDVNLYLRYHGLLTLSNEEELGHLVVWREIFPTSRHSSPCQVVPGYTETDGRWFMLVVGMRNAVFGVLLEAGGCAEKAEGHPTPDPFYIDQANATLIQLQTLDVFSQCECRLEGPPVPSLSCVDWFISTKGDKGYQAQSWAFVQPPKVKKTKPKSILKKKNPIGSSGSLTQLNKQERYVFTGSAERFSSESDLRYDSTQLEDEYFSSDSSDEANGVPGRNNAQMLADSNEMLASSTGSRLFKGPKPSHNLLSMYDISDLRRNPEDVGLAEVGSLVKLTNGYQNTLFHYVLMDGHDGIYICPAQQEMRQVASPTHNVVLKHFNAACLEIHRLFEQSLLKASHVTKSRSRFSTNEAVLGKVKEHGILFHCPLSQTTDTKKPPPSTAYWVVGRLFDSPVPSEFYVCFHDSAQQNLVEMAFKLMQGTLI